MKPFSIDNYKKNVQKGTQLLSGSSKILLLRYFMVEFTFLSLYIEVRVYEIVFNFQEDSRIDFHICGKKMILASPVSAE